MEVESEIDNALDKFYLNEFKEKNEEIYEHMMIWKKEYHNNIFKKEF